jgi:hypothetical protein
VVRSKAVLNTKGKGEGRTICHSSRGTERGHGTIDSQASSRKRLAPEVIQPLSELLKKTKGIEKSH